MVVLTCCLKFSLWRSFFRYVPESPFYKGPSLPWASWSGSSTARLGYCNMEKVFCIHFDPCDSQSKTNIICEVVNWDSHHWKYSPLLTEASSDRSLSSVSGGWCVVLVEGLAVTLVLGSGGGTSVTMWRHCSSSSILSINKKTNTD